MAKKTKKTQKSGKKKDQAVFHDISKDKKKKNPDEAILIEEEFIDEY